MLYTSLYFFFSLCSSMEPPWPVRMSNGHAACKCANFPKALSGFVRLPDARPVTGRGRTSVLDLICGGGRSALVDCAGGALADGARRRPGRALVLEHLRLARPAHSD